MEQAFILSVAVVYPSEFLFTVIFAQLLVVTTSFSLVSLCKVCPLQFRAAALAQGSFLVVLGRGVVG